VSAAWQSGRSRRKTPEGHHELLRLWPEPLGFYRVWQAYIRAFESLGTNPTSAATSKARSFELQINRARDLTGNSTGIQTRQGREYPMGCDDDP